MTEPDQASILELCKDKMGWVPTETVYREGADHHVVVASNTDHRVVVRCPKTPNDMWLKETLASTDWLRSHDILIPEVLHYGEAGDGLPTPWMMLEYGGEPLNTIGIPDERARLDEEAGEMLAQIHRNTFDQTGVIDLRTGEFEPMDFFSERAGQASSALEWFAETDSIDARTRGALQEVLDDLVGTPTVALCHGDYTPDNLLVQEDRIRYAVDWGHRLNFDDPLSDLIRWEMVRSMWGGTFEAPRRGYFREVESQARYWDQRLSMLVQQVIIRMHAIRNLQIEEADRRFRSLLWTLMESRL
jgi:aminoglycoside phosphotransferase (APT) family kinase protein